MAARRRSPPVRTFLIEPLSRLPDSEEETAGVIDDDDVEYDPEVVEQVLKAAEGPLIVAGTVEEACRILGIASEANSDENAPEGGLDREAEDTPHADE